MERYLILAVFSKESEKKKVAAGVSGCNLVIFLRRVWSLTAQRFTQLFQSLTHRINFTLGNSDSELNAVEKEWLTPDDPSVALTLIPNIPNSF